MATEKWTIVSGAGPAALQAATAALDAADYRVSFTNGESHTQLETGSALMRALLGGWVKRHKLELLLIESDGALELWMQPTMSGWGGGALGKSKASKEHSNAAVAIDSSLAANGLVVAHRTEQ